MIENLILIDQILIAVSEIESIKEVRTRHNEERTIVNMKSGNVLWLHGYCIEKIEKLIAKNLEGGGR